MNIIFLGAPGAGKGTQSAYLKKQFGMAVISTGDMLRQSVNEKTPIGIKAATYMEEGKLVPDSIIISMLKERISQPDCETGFVLDGFPRNLKQAGELDHMLHQKNKSIDLVIYLSVNEDDLVDRIVGRFVCDGCGKTYHETLAPPKKEGVCDVCGHEHFSKRKDDNKETIQARLKEYHRLTMPILPFYEKQGCLAKIDGMRPPNEVTHDIVKVVKEHQTC